MKIAMINLNVLIKKRDLETHVAHPRALKQIPFRGLCFTGGR